MSIWEEVVTSKEHIHEKFVGAITKAFRKYMNENSLNQKTLAKKLNVSESHISQILNEKQNYKVKTLIDTLYKLDMAPVLSIENRNYYLNQIKEPESSKVYDSGLTTPNLEHEALLEAINRARLGIAPPFQEGITAYNSFVYQSSIYLKAPAYPPAGSVSRGWDDDRNTKAAA